MKWTDGNMNPIPNWKAPSSPKKGGITVLGERDTDLISETGNNTTTDLEAGKDVTNLTSHALIDGEWIQVSANLLH